MAAQSRGVIAARNPLTGRPSCHCATEGGRGAMLCETPASPSPREEGDLLRAAGRERSRSFAEEEFRGDRDLGRIEEHGRVAYVGNLAEPSPGSADRHLCRRRSEERRVGK